MSKLAFSDTKSHKSALLIPAALLISALWLFAAAAAPQQTGRVPLPQFPALASVTLNPTSVTGGASTTGTVILTAPAPKGGANVSLSSSDAAARVLGRVPVGKEPTVTVAGGKTTASFNVGTQPVLHSIPVTISASYGGATKSAVLTVLAPTLRSLACQRVRIRGGNDATCTVKLTGPVASLPFPSPGFYYYNISSSNPEVAGRPPGGFPPPPQWMGNVAAGETTDNFTVRTSPVTKPVTVIISVSRGEVVKSTKLTVTP